MSYISAISEDAVESEAPFCRHKCHINLILIKSRSDISKYKVLCRHLVDTERKHQAGRVSPCLFIILCSLIVCDYYLQKHNIQILNVAHITTEGTADLTIQK